MTTVSQNVWNAELYDDKISFVSEFGKSVVNLLDPKPQERILDLGCGTGDLAEEIARSGAIPIGIDLSPSMIERARQKYPNLQFSVENAVAFRTGEPFDAVFSNAALHWIKQASDVVDSVWHALRPGGRFVAEFGGKGNVQTIIEGIRTTLEEHGISAVSRNPWYFPSIGEYSSLLEQSGFRVTYAIHFDRPTVLEDGDNGLKHWLTTFGDDLFLGLSDAERSEIFSQISMVLRPSLFENGRWIADYKRIRVRAIKPV